MRCRGLTLLGVVLVLAGAADAAPPPQRRLHPHGQPGAVDARLLRQRRHPHAEHRSARRAGNAVHPLLQLQRRLLADPGDVPHRPASLAARRSLLPASRRRTDRTEGALRHRRVPHAAADPGGRGVRLRAEREVAPGGQPDPAARVQRVGHDAARAHDDVLRRGGDRRRQGAHASRVT